jgi:hypothetical protein
VTDQTVTVSATGARVLAPPTGATHVILSVMSDGTEVLQVSNDSTYGTGKHGIAFGGGDKPTPLVLRLPNGTPGSGLINIVNQQGSSVDVGVHYFYDG